MNNRYTNLFRFFFAVMDLSALNLVHIVLMFMMERVQGMNDHAYLLFFLVTNITWLCCAYASALYINDKMLNFERFAKRTVHAFLLFLIIVLLFVFLYHYSYSRIYVVLSFTGFGITLLLTRFFFIIGAEYFRHHDRFMKKIVVLGYNQLSKKLVDYFSLNNKTISVEGYFEDFQHVKELSTFPILGGLQECITYSISNNVNEIYSTISPEKYSFIYELAQAAEKNMIRFKYVPDFHVFVNRNIHIDYLEDIPVLSLRAEPLDDVAARIKKRIFDIGFSFMVFVFLLSWLIPILAVLIKLDSKGPVFFTQLRSGKDNRTFKCIKFRSLRENVQSEVKQVSKDDARFTRLGRFLRKTNLDELPQFINVFMGDMSIVGPRPHMLKHTKDFSSIVTDYMSRHYVKPGITGYAQVNGYRGEIRQEEQLKKRIEYDLWYMEHWTFWLDIRIIFLTIYLTFKGDDNAY